MQIVVCSHVIIPIFKKTTHESVLSIIHAEIESASSWCAKNNQLLNANKIKILNIFFSPYGWKPLETDIYSSLFVDNLKILGLIFDNKLKWKSHVNQIIKITSQRLYALRVLKNIMKRDELKAIYTAIIRSIIDYGSPVFVTISKDLKASLNRIQKRAHYIIYGTNHSLNLEDLECRKERISLKLFNTINNSNEHILKSFMPFTSMRTGNFIMPICNTNRKSHTFFIHHIM